MELLFKITIILGLTCSLSHSMGLENGNSTHENQTTPTPQNQTPPPSSDILGAPQNLRSQSVHNAIAVFWDAVDGATEYYVTLSDGQDQFIGETQVAFGGLNSSTSYTAVVSAVGANRIVSTNTSSIIVETLINRVRNLRTSGATETSISVEWTPIPDVSTYLVTVNDNDNQEIEADITIDGTSAVVSGLEPHTYYYILVAPVRGGDGGLNNQLRARTDGSGVFVTALWSGSEGVFGGEAMILKPINNQPSDTYNVQLNFGCSLSLVRVWNANYNGNASNLIDGTVIIQQEELWQLEKSEIGLNFYYDLESSTSTNFCSINSSIPADFGISITLPQQDGNATTILVPVVVREWDSTSVAVARTAGLVEILLGDVFDSPQDNAKELIGRPKPPVGTFIIKVNFGPDCPVGLIVRYSWSMTHKSAAGIAGVDPNAIYFVQQGSDWFSNEPGFIYGYNPLLCRSRNGITAQVIINGPLINLIINATNVDPSY